METIDIRGPDNVLYRIPKIQLEDFEAWVLLCQASNMDFIRPIYALPINEKDFIL